MRIKDYLTKRKEDLGVLLNVNLFKNVKSQLVSQTGIMPRFLNEKLLDSPEENSPNNRKRYNSVIQGVHGEIQRIDSSLISFAKQLRTKQVKYVWQGADAEVDTYFIDGADNMSAKVSIYETDIDVVIFYSTPKRTESICHATFTNYGLKKTNEHVNIHYGYRDFDSSTAHVLDSLAHYHFKSIRKNHQRNYKKGFDNQAFFPQSTVSHVESTSAVSFEVAKNDNHEASLAVIKTLGVQLNEHRSLLSIEEKHRLDTILSDVEQLTSTTYNLIGNDEDIVRHIGTGLQVAAVKLHEIHGAVKHKKRTEVLRQVEILKQR